MTVTCKAEESLTCSCVDVGTIIDGSDCSVDIHQTYANKAEAEAALNRFIEKARKTESDPCDIKSEITETENGANLTARFIFLLKSRLNHYRKRLLNLIQSRRFII